MLVSHKRNFIYTKTIKTASTSVESYFERFCMPQGEWKPTLFRPEYESDTGIIGYRGIHDREILRKCKWHDHMTAAAIRRKLGKRIWDEYFKFCVVRNPFDRAVSAFFFFEELERRGMETLQLDAVDDRVARFREWVRKYVVRKHVIDDRGCYTIGNQICMDYVIRFENLIPGMKHVCEQVGVGFARRKLRNFVSGHRPQDLCLADLYDAATKDVVAKHFRFELEQFDYEFTG